MFNFEPQEFITNNRQNPLRVLEKIVPYAYRYTCTTIMKFTQTFNEYIPHLE